MHAAQRSERSASASRGAVQQPLPAAAVAAVTATVCVLCEGRGGVRCSCCDAVAQDHGECYYFLYCSLHIALVALQPQCSVFSVVDSADSCSLHVPTAYCMLRKLTYAISSHMTSVSAL
jgi:hypothetical protein